MLGDQLERETGQITGMRVLSTSGEPKVEVSFQGKGQLMGVDVTDMGTYRSVMRPDGSMYGEGQGITMTSEGETVTWTGSGVGRPLGRGDASTWRGAVYYHTTSQKLAGLNSVVGVFEYENDENGNVEITVYEWK